MVPFLLASALAASPTDDATLATARGRPPREAGDILLAGQDHGVIEKVETVTLNGAVPPGWTEVDLIEHADPIDGGCRRRRWILTGIRGPNQTDDAVRLTVSFPAVEVARSSPLGCRAVKYARLSGEITESEAIDALAYLDRLGSGRTRADLSCSDKTDTHLCRTRKSVLLALTQSDVSDVSREGNVIELWLTSDAPFTTVRYSLASPARVRVKREYPPPF